jgi:hypothetical protein
LKIDSFQLGTDAAGIAQIQALFQNAASETVIEALCNLGFCYGSIVLCLDISSRGVAYLVAQSPAAQYAADLEWVCNALNRFESGWWMDAAGRLYSPSSSCLAVGQIREALLASKNAAVPHSLPLATVA